MAGRCRSCCRKYSPAITGSGYPRPAPYRRFVTWLADRDLDAAQAAWREVLAGFDTPTLVGPPDRLGLGPRGVASYRVPSRDHPGR